MDQNKHFSKTTNRIRSATHQAKIDMSKLHDSHKDAKGSIDYGNLGIIKSQSAVNQVSKNDQVATHNDNIRPRHGTDIRKHEGIASHRTQNPEKTDREFDDPLDVPDEESNIQAKNMLNQQ